MTRWLLGLLLVAGCATDTERTPEPSLCEIGNQVTGVLNWNRDWQALPSDEGFKQEYRAWVLARTGYLVWAASMGSEGNCLERALTPEEETNMAILEQAIAAAPPCGSTSGWSATRERDPRQTFENWLPEEFQNTFDSWTVRKEFLEAEMWLGSVGLIRILNCQMSHD